jgi:hypothetical protein
MSDVHVNPNDELIKTAVAVKASRTFRKENRGALRDAIEAALETVEHAIDKAEAAAASIRTAKNEADMADADQTACELDSVEDELIDVSCSLWDAHAALQLTLMDLGEEGEDDDPDEGGPDALDGAKEAGDELDGGNGDGDGAAACHTVSPSMSDADIEAFIEVVGMARVLAALDRLTAPTKINATG